MDVYKNVCQYLTGKFALRFCVIFRIFAENSYYYGNIPDTSSKPTSQSSIARFGGTEVDYYPALAKD
jgi:hypothetical protein